MQVILQADQRPNHGSLPREDDGAIEFCRIKDYLQNHFVYSLNIGLMKSGRASWQEEEETRTVLY